MQIRPSHRQGSVVLTAVIFTVVISILLASYLILTRDQSVLSMRSQAWNLALAVAEAGVEEAMSQINSKGTNIVASNGWEVVNDTYLRKSGTVADGRYVAAIIPGTPPIVIADGYNRAPITGEWLRRTVRVRTRLDPRFSRGMVVRDTVDLKGNNISIDSFDSADPNFSTDGRYDAAKRKDNGSVATVSGFVDSFNNGNADIRGTVATAPGGTVAVGPGGVVGHNAWHDAGETGIEPGAVSDDFNMDIEDVQAPSALALTPLPGIVDGTTYTYILEDGNYQISSPLRFTGKVLVTGNAVLVVSSGVQFSGDDFIQISPRASLELYVSANQASIGGQGVINETGDAANFIYFGLPSNKNLSFGGNGAFVGSIYAPSTDFTLGGGGNSIQDFAGASVTRSVQMNGKYNFHYDENLIRRWFRGYVPDSWDEMHYSLEEMMANNLYLAGL